MNTELSAIPKFKPLSVIELLDHAFRIYRRNFMLFVGIVGAVYLPWGLLLGIVTVALTSISSGSSGFSAPPAEPNWLLVSVLVGLLLLLGLLGAVLLLWVEGAMTRAVVGFYLGQPITFGEAYQYAFRKTSKIIQLWGLGVLLGIAALLWSLIPCIGWSTGLGLMYFWGITYSLALPVLMVEDVSAGRAMRRAFDLARRNFWSVVGVFALLAIFSYILGIIPTFILSYVTAASVSLPNGAVIKEIVQQVFSLAMNLFILPFSLTLMVLVYFDLRVRFEGFDLSWMAEHLLDPLATADTVATRTPTTPADPIGANDLLNFFLLSLACGAVFGMMTALILGLIAIASLLTAGL